MPEQIETDWVVAVAGTVTDYTFDKDEVEKGGEPSQRRGRGGGTPKEAKKMSTNARCRALARMQKAYRSDGSQSDKGERTYARFFADIEQSQQKDQWVVSELAMLAKLRAAAADQTPKVCSPSVGLLTHRC